MSTNKKNFFINTSIIKKADLVLLLILIIAGLVATFYLSSTASTGKQAIIKVDGQVYGTYDLSENRSIEITSGDHVNKVTIKDGQVSMEFSNCPNQLCVNQGAINTTSQAIVCIPNKVTVEIVGGEEEFDAITK